jgi:hypothetical protein
MEFRPQGDLHLLEVCLHADVITGRFAGPFLRPFSIAKESPRKLLLNHFATVCDCRLKRVKLSEIASLEG